MNMRRGFLLAFLSIFVMVGMVFTYMPQAKGSGSEDNYLKENDNNAKKEKLSPPRPILKELFAQPGNGLNGQGLIPPMPDLCNIDESCQKKYLASLSQYYDSYNYESKHRNKVFEWQLFSSKIIFGIVVILVFSGIYFATIQFHKDLGRRSGNKNIDEAEYSELEASLKGVKVRSPVLGVIILVLSLAFFYLYLIYVYPITPIN